MKIQLRFSTPKVKLLLHISTRKCEHERFAFLYSDANNCAHFPLQWFRKNAIRQASFSSSVQENKCIFYS